MWIDRGPMKRERESREVWAKRVERWKDSGLVCAEFCSEIDVNPRTLLYWAWRLRKDGVASTGKAKPVEPRQKALPKAPAPRKRSSKVAEATFMELVTAPAAPVPDAIEIVVRSVTVRVPQTAAADIVRRAFDLAEKQK